MTKQEVRIVVREELAKLSDKQDTLSGTLETDRKDNQKMVSV